MFLLPIPSGGRAVLTRATDDLLYPAAARGALCLPSRAAAGTRVLARSLGTHRCRLLLRWMNSTSVDLFMSTFVEMIVDFFVEVGRLWRGSVLRRKKAALMGGCGLYEKRRWLLWLCLPWVMLWGHLRDGLLQSCDGRDALCKKLVADGNYFSCGFQALLSS